MNTVPLATWKKLTFAVLAVFSSLFLVLLACEVGLRISYDEAEVNGNYWGIGAFSSHDQAGYYHAPHFDGYVSRPGVFKIPVRIDALGLRQQDLDQQLQYPQKLLILGDSFPFGLGVLEAQSYPSLLKEDLNPLGIGVINSAQAGYSVEQEWLFGLPLIEHLDPGFVLLSLFASNDIAGDYHKQYLNVDVRYGYRLQKDRSLPIKPVDYLRTHSYLWLFIRHRLNVRRGRQKQAQFNALLQTSLDEIIQPTLSAITKLRDYCEATGIIFGVVMIPPGPGKTPFDQRLGVFFEEEEIEVVDLGSKGYTNQDYLQGDGHWNERGHQKAAQYLAPFISTLMDTTHAVSLPQPSEQQ